MRPRRAQRPAGRLQPYGLSGRSPPELASSGTASYCPTAALPASSWCGAALRRVVNCSRLLLPSLNSKSLPPPLSLSGGFNGLLFHLFIQSPPPSATFSGLLTVCLTDGLIVREQLSHLISPLCSCSRSLSEEGAARLQRRAGGHLNICLRCNGKRASAGLRSSLQGSSPCFCDRLSELLMPGVDLGTPVCALRCQIAAPPSPFAPLLVPCAPFHPVWAPPPTRRRRRPSRTPCCQGSGVRAVWAVPAGGLLWVPLLVHALPGRFGQSSRPLGAGH